MTGNEQQNQMADELARDILRLSRNTLMIHLRFLDAALIQFVPAPAELTRDLATNGRYLYYNVWHVLRSYKSAREIPVRDYLHVTLHCVFRHLFIGRKVNARVWNLACDIAVENTIAGLGLKSLLCARAHRQTELLEKLRDEVRPLTAEKLYRYFIDQKLPAGEYEHLRYNFYADDHELWYEEQQETSQGKGSDGEDDSAAETDVGDAVSQGEESDETTQPPVDGEEEESGGDGLFTGEGTDNGGGDGASDDQDDRRGDQPNLTRDELEQLWKDISERIQVDLETSSNTWGQSAGDMIQELKAVNREKYNYAEFLRRFAVLGENVEINDEEFDYIFYTYGLNVYDNMPLVEPLEYKEVKRIREFVIALDTSQSVAGETVQKFVTKTYNILKQTENFFTKTNIHILQCGASVVEDAVITCEEDFDAYIRTMKLRGFGGTDFRPVFSYVDKMIATHEFTNFKGLIYFTDGYGTYPEKKPDYDAVFVFVNNTSDIPDLPVWAIKLVLTSEEIELF